MPAESSSRSLLPLRSDATDLPPAQAGTSSLVPCALLVQCLSSPLAHFKPGTPIVVDGNCRSKCIENAHRKLKASGYLYLDNSDTNMTSPDGDMRLAEAKMRKLAEEWSAPLKFYTGYAPGQL